MERVSLNKDCDCNLCNLYGFCYLDSKMVKIILKILTKHFTQTFDLNLVYLDFTGYKEVTLTFEDSPENIE